MEQRYKVLLENPAAMQQYKGLKHVDDKHDAFWLAHMARLGIIPQGYIYPKEERPFLDLLRKEVIWFVCEHPKSKACRGSSVETAAAA